nr:hypothetical protein [uncultured Rhodopila sp.]
MRIAGRHSAAASNLVVRYQPQRASAFRIVSRAAVETDKHEDIGVLWRFADLFTPLAAG